MNWLIFFFGIMVGGTIGIVTASLLAAASRYGDELDGSR